MEQIKQIGELSDDDLQKKAQCFNVWIHAEMNLRKYGIPCFIVGVLSIIIGLFILGPSFGPAGYFSGIVGMFICLFVLIYFAVIASQHRRKTGIARAEIRTFLTGIDDEQQG